MEQKPKVIFKNVSKKYLLHKRKIDRLLEILSLKSSKRNFYALRNITFTVNEGETIGVIGINGSGKSTLSNILAQVVPPTDGEIQVFGETSLIAIAVGLNNNLTGMENIELKCLMHGMKKEEIIKITPEIVDFADIGDFIDQPVKSYSSGMKSRLGFAISAHTNPDILIIDEALSVGDQTFYDKCINKMNEFKKEGKTIFFISHSIPQVRSFCDKVIWLHHGEIAAFGEAKVVIDKYNEFIKWFNSLNNKQQKEYKIEKISLQKKEVPSETFVPNLTRIRKSHHQGKKKSGFLLQLTFLISLLIISTFLMLFNSTSFTESTNEHDVSLVTNEEQKEKNITQQEVNKTGYIVSNKVNLYKAVGDEDKLLSIEFMQEIFIKNKIDDYYEVKVGDFNGYILSEEIIIPDEIQKYSDIEISDLLPALPISFSSAYEYYLLFLNEEDEVVESSLNGKTGERSDSLGNKYISYGDIEYRFNGTNISDQIIIKDISLESLDVEEMIQEATYKNQNEDFIYFATENLKYILDLKQNILVIKK